MNLNDEARELVAAAGKYLRNPVREPGITCEVCTSPTYGQTRCNPCADAAATFDGLADLVVPLTYSIGAGMSAKVLRHYKDDDNPNMRRYCTGIVSRALHLGIALHRPCIEQRLGPITTILFVPSTRGLRDFADVVHDMQVGAVDHLTPGRGDVAESLVVGHRPTKGDRTVTPHKFVLAGDATGHVLILDDSWTTGANAQSCALTVRRAGAAAVTVMTVGRRINWGWSTDWPEGTPPCYRNNGDFVRKYLRSYDPYLCPVTGNPCAATPPARSRDPQDWW